LGDQEFAVMERAEHAARAVLSRVLLTPQHWGLIHFDLRPSNVMTHEGAMTIIDFDDCGDGYYLYDFGSALTFYEHRPEALAMAANWLDGYREVAPLSRDDLEAAAALSLMRRLTMLGWATTHRADALPADLWDENRPGSGARKTRDPGRRTRPRTGASADIAGFSERELLLVRRGGRRRGHRGDDRLGDRLRGGGLSRRGGAGGGGGARGLRRLFHLALEDAHRLRDAAGERRQLRAAEQQNDDAQDDEEVPASEVSQHGGCPFEWSACRSIAEVRPVVRRE
jgi:hypothetical protein